MDTTIRLDRPPVMSVTGTGLAYGKFQAANYSLTIVGKGKTGPKAKLATRAVQEKLYKALNNLQENGVTLVNGKTRSSLSVEKDYDRGNFRIFSGYKATFTMTFRSRDLERIAEIHDALTSIEGAEVASPSFLMNPEHKEGLRRQAFEGAVKQAKQRFGEQCAVLGFDSEQFEIVNWDSRSGRDDKSFRGKGLSNNFSPLENDEDFFIAIRDSVESGEARMELSVTLNYSKRA